MPEQATSAQGRGDGSGQETAELREELARSRQEVLRLRDLLIGKDAELGTLRGRVAELEEGSARMLVAVQRLRARVPRASGAIARLRKLRGGRG